MRIRVLYRKQKQSVLAVWNLKINYLAISFSVVYFVAKFILKKVKMKYFVQNEVVKTHFPIWELLHDFAVSAINYVSLGYVELSKTLFHNSWKCRFLKYATLRTTSTTLKTSSKRKRRETKYKIFSILNIEC